MKTPPMRQLMIRRGPEFYEFKDRDAAGNKWKTTKVPVYPVCGVGPTNCKWCRGILGPNNTLMEFPTKVISIAGKLPSMIVHTITPPQAAHLIAFEFGPAHPNEPFQVGWVLTDEEKEAGKKGIAWPEDV